MKYNMNMVLILLFLIIPFRFRFPPRFGGGHHSNESICRLFSRSISSFLCVWCIVSFPHYVVHISYVHRNLQSQPLARLKDVPLCVMAPGRQRKTTGEGGRRTFSLGRGGRQGEFL